MTAKKKNVIGYVLASLAIIAADQALKAWVVRNIPLNASAAQQRALIPGVVHLTHIRNSGVAFGMFSGGRWLFLALLAAFCVIVVWALVRHKLTAPWERWLAVLAMAGAIGNGIDRALYGYVVDKHKTRPPHDLFAVRRALFYWEKNHAGLYLSSRPCALCAYEVHALAVVRASVPWADEALIRRAAKRRHGAGITR